MDAAKIRRRKLLRLSCVIFAALQIVQFLNSVQAADSTWLSGEPLRQALTQKVSVTWSNLSVRAALNRFGKSQKIAVILDRRIDPDQKIDLTFEDVPLAEAIERIAAQIHAGVTMLGPVAYFGPKSMTERLQTITALRKEDVSRLTTSARARWVQGKPWKWYDLSTPRELLTALETESGIKIDGIEQVPHDLWAAADLPPLGLAERLSLILAQFDLTYELSNDGKSIRLMQAPEKPVIEHTYPVNGSAQELAAQLKQRKMLADAEINAVGNKLVVRSRQEDQDAIADLLAGRTAKRTTVTEGRKVYTLRVEAPVSKLLNSIGKQLELDIQIDRMAIAQADISLEKTVKLDVKEVTADELFKGILEPVGLTFTHRGNVIEVKPK